MRRRYGGEWYEFPHIDFEEPVLSHSRICVKTKSAETYKTAFENICQMYRRGQFRVRRIHVDNEFRPLMKRFEQRGIETNYANPQEHVPEAERNNRVIKERIRATYHRLPYTRLPRIMVIALVQESAKKLNMFPAKHGVSQYYSPRMILSRRTLDYGKHCKHAYGMYVQAHNEPEHSNTNTPRSLCCIYLRYNDNDQGGHDCLHLQTNSIVTRRNVTPIPITPAVISQVHHIAKHDGMPDGLKIKNRHGDILYDSAWIARVDYDENEFEEYQEDQDYEDDSDSDEATEENLTNEENEQVYDELDGEELAELQQQNVREDDDYSDDDDNVENTDDQEEESVENNDDEHVEDEENSSYRSDNNNDTGDNDSEISEIEEDEEDSTPSEDEEQQEGDDTQQTTRPGRAIRPPGYHVEYQAHIQMEVKANDYHCHLQSPAESSGRIEEYSAETARVVAKVMCFMHEALHVDTTMSKDTNMHQHVQTYSLAKGIKQFGERGRAAAHKEMKQLHDREVFAPIHVHELTAQERKRAMESLIFLVQKQDDSIKARTCANGSTQREYTERDESASPTATTESILLTATIDAKQGRDVVTADIPNAFVQTPIGEREVGERIIMKIRGVLVDILVEMAPEVYSEYMVYENGKKVLYVLMLMALYGMLQSSLLYYKKFRMDIEEIGYKMNPFDPCVANKIICKKQHTVTWHVDDLKASHVSAKVNDDFYLWLNDKYGDHGEVKATRGDRHDYLAMILDFSTPGVLKVDMVDYVKKMIDEFPEELTDKADHPWSERLFKVDDSSKKLDEKRASVFHTFVMKGMFVCKRARQDIQPAIAFLATRVQVSTEQDWKKLKKVLSFMKRTQDDVLTLEANDVQKIEWWVDASFAVHPDMRSHTGAYMTLGKGSVASISTKQKINTSSSTEAELVSIDDVISKVLWTKRFLEHQGFEIETTVIYRDNTSSMKLEENGRASASKRTRHFDIKYFYLTDLIQRGEVTIEYCPTADMGADYFTKPLVGVPFLKFRVRTMNFPTP